MTPFESWITNDIQRIGQNIKLILRRLDEIVKLLEKLVILTEIKEINDHHNNTSDPSKDV